jgi:nitroreductase
MHFKKFIPQALKRRYWFIRHSLKMLSELWVEYRHYMTHSGTGNVSMTSKNLESRITALYHTLEKALSFEEIRPGFGRENIMDLTRLLNEPIAKSGELSESQCVLSALNALREYQQFHRKISYDLDEALNKEVERVLESHSEGDAPFRKISKEELLVGVGAIFPEFTQTRHSIRGFSSRKVDEDDVRIAISRAKYAPSVCNRQTSRAYWIKDKEKLERALVLQRGNRGFHNLNHVLVVTSLTEAFAGANERFQGYIDSGIFAMNLLYHLVARGLGTCPLCWCHSSEESQELRTLLNIPTNERIIMMIGFGHYLGKVGVTASQKNEDSHYLKIIGEN